MDDKQVHVDRQVRFGIFLPQMYQWKEMLRHAQEKARRFSHRVPGAARSRSSVRLKNFVKAV